MITSFTFRYNRKAMSRLSRKHQVTLPVSVLREAGLTAGDELVIRVTGRGRVELERADDVINRFAGSLPAGTYPPRYLEELRDEWRV
jgi:bifunctional DNA-binding transcriptional regulator/antitoxin component of YhaV-PrlF toxin-antitoxin module